MPLPRIAIIGAGAIGSILGALLSRAGHEVTLIGRSEHVHAINRNGLQVEGVFGSFIAPVAAATALDFQPDFAFLTVKTQDVLSAVEANRPFLTDTPVVTFQNGVRSDELLATLLPQTQILSTVVTLNASYLIPGTVTALYPGSLVIGRPYGPVDAHVEAVATMLGRIITTRVSTNIIGAHWLKLIVNLNNALPTLTNMTLQQLYAEPYLRQLAVHMMREGVQVVKEAGIRLASLPDVSTTLIQVLVSLPVPLASVILATKANSIGRERPLLVSTLQSLHRGRPTEIGYLNGEIVRVGQQWNVPTPVNASIVEMIYQTEQTGQFWTIDRIRSRIHSAVQSTKTRK